MTPAIVIAKELLEGDGWTLETTYSKELEFGEVDQQSVAPCMTIVTQPGFQEDEPEKYEALKSAYHSEEVRNWYGDYLGGLLAPACDRDIDAAGEEANQ